MNQLNSFQIRALSAVVAVLFVFLLFYFLQINGLKILISFAALVGSFEVYKLLFKSDDIPFFHIIFVFLNIIIFSATSFAVSFGALVFTISMIVIIALFILSKRAERELASIQKLILHTLIGFFYTGVLPALIYKTLDQNQGLGWFLFLLLSVFFCDTLAYIFGVLIGKNKFMPFISPKKTLEGSFGGILGSALGGLIAWTLFFKSQPLFPFLLLAIVAGFFSQIGDLFESLLKRLANVKDSGHIMPGHGGVLDRIDGVLFAGPIVFAGKLIISHFFT